MAQIQQVVQLTPGQSIVLPAGAVINSFLTTGDTVVNSSCDNLPPQDEYVCIQFSFSDSEAAASGGAVEAGTVDTITIGGTVYTINVALDDGLTNVANAINTVMGPIFVVYSGAADVLAERVETVLGVRVPSLLKDTIEFKLTGTGFYGGIIVPHTDVANCDCVTTGGPPSSSFC